MSQCVIATCPFVPWQGSGSKIMVGKQTEGESTPRRRLEELPVDSTGRVRAVGTGHPPGAGPRQLRHELVLNRLQGAEPQSAKRRPEIVRVEGITHRLGPSARHRIEADLIADLAEEQRVVGAFHRGDENRTQILRLIDWRRPDGSHPRTEAHRLVGHDLPRCGLVLAERARLTDHEDLVTGPHAHAVEEQVARTDSRGGAVADDRRAYLGHFAFSRLAPALVAPPRPPSAPGRMNTASNCHMRRSCRLKYPGSIKCGWNPRSSMRSIIWR